ncbi:MAG: hypothetical protein WAL52_12875 [Candidatus Sulfotelmatobacter sp.]
MKIKGFTSDDGHSPALIHLILIHPKLPGGGRDAAQCAVDQCSVRTFPQA